MGYQEPDTSRGDVRVDSGITEGSEISMFYDPMISKLCSYGEDRTQAIATMRKALDTYRIAGVQHNIPFLRSVMDNPRFEGGSFDTTQIESLVCAAAVIRYENVRRNNSITDQLPSLSEDIPSVSSMVING